MTALYVHIPFCETKCPYCDFNSFAVQGRDVSGYLDALFAEFDARGVPEDPATIFVGGGTPTVVEPRQLDRYLGELASRVRPNAEREFTVEANPGSLTAEKAAILREHGVNRLSLGAQSLYDRHLKTLGRAHSAGQVEEAYALVRSAGFDNVSLDLVYAIPGMTRREWAETLDRVVEWEPEHLSCHALVFEPGTEFFARRSGGRLRPLPERDELAMFRFAQRRLAAAELARYEISNFARPGRECRHNLTYWRNSSYAGFGAGAFSYLEGWRLGNEGHLGRYADAVGRRGNAFVSRERLEGLRGAREMVALGLRMAEGVDLAEIGLRFGVNARAQFASRIRDLEAAGFVRDGERLRLARRGWRVADEVASVFV